MPAPTMQSTASRVRRVAITIPASGGTADTLENLVVAALNVIQENLGNKEKPKIIGGRVNAVATAYNAGDVVGTQPLAILANAIYEEPSTQFLKLTYVKSTAGSISAVVSVYLDGEA